MSQETESSFGRRPNNDRRFRKTTLSVAPAHRFRDFRLICEIEKNVVSQPPIHWKRSQDILCILLSIPIVLPLMLMIAVWIRLVSSGPALFQQERIGVNGNRFVLYKFRSMKMNCETSRHENHLKHLVHTNSPMTKLDLLSDSRLIPGGYFLRAAGLDELPQLFNVLRGEMSLVGPRPCLPAEYGFFSMKNRERFKILPGLTGMWQVSGKNESTFEEMNVLDTEYVRSGSLALDLQIMMKTPWALFSQMHHAMQLRRLQRKRIITLEPWRSPNLQ